MTQTLFQNATFMKSVAQLSDLPPDVGQEVAFLGRSNVGKSSTLNCLTEQRQLARVSQVPGRTQLLNFFALSPTQRLVDLPGYGFAKVPLAVKKAWHILMDGYLNHRQSLKGIVLIMDARHPLMPQDQEIIVWLKACHFPLHVLLNKSDKLTPAQSRLVLGQVEQALMSLGDKDTPCSLQLFSAQTKLGLPVLRKRLLEWL